MLNNIKPLILRIDYTVLKILFSFFFKFCRIYIIRFRVTMEIKISQAEISHVKTMSSNHNYCAQKGQGVIACMYYNSSTKQAN